MDATIAPKRAERADNMGAVTDEDYAVAHETIQGCTVGFVSAHPIDTERRVAHDGLDPRDNFVLGDFKSGIWLGA